MRNIVYLLIVIIVAASCKSSSVPSSSDEKYTEDLTSLRPSIPEVADSVSKPITVDVEDAYAGITPKYDITTKLNAVLDSIQSLRSEIRYVDGFTILVYSGTDNKEAHIARGKVYSTLPDSSPSLKFDEPNFRVKVGKYYSRVEAQKPYAELKKKFPKAIIIPERIYID